ncbi:sensor histidine kinase [Dictyobacter arantiisoli]|uniref:Histidine kinase domain-containing protein n=1 Tax=Dictyobacter arantiisoli TaxID=2014874 RepID=A0A5A5T9N4_9CHLR|nr:ATP-binding protein [Dictyobacter arantiisoli]GCF07699.1 hypothetical protein KDI_12630 [Dictyobacter arantiisoli]
MPVLFFHTPTFFLQVVTLALSTFNFIAFLWLACTVWLNGDRRSMIARVGVVGLSLTALFFFLHALLMSGSLSKTTGPVSTDFLWRLIWFPALGVPYIWFVIGLHYASFLNNKWRRRRPFLLICSAILGCSALLILLFNQSTFTFKETLLLLAYSSDVDGSMHIGLFSPLILLSIIFLLYVTFCAIGPWFTPARIGRVLATLWRFFLLRKHMGSLRRALVEAFWKDQITAEQLEEPMLSWHLARPVLLLAAVLMTCLTASLGFLGVWTMVKWLHLQTIDNISALTSSELNTIPTSLLILDVYATGCVAVMVLLIGYSIVRHGILIERPLARRGFFEQWRGIVLMATTISLLVALLLLLTRSSLGGLLLITAIATGTYALFTWSSYTAHDRYVSLLGPFLHNTSMRHWLNTDLQKTEQNMEELFFHLCKEILEVRCARLVVLSGPFRSSFAYRWSLVDPPERTENMDQEQVLGRSAQHQNLRSDFNAYRIRVTIQGFPVICWVLPIYDELGLVAKLYLGPREDRGAFTNEDMDLAQACGQRILDTLRDHEAMLAVAALLRRRIVDVKLLGAQQRRVLHDETLPMLHLALLRLETARSLRTPEDASDDVREVPFERAEQALDEAIDSISAAHRQLASMMRAMSTGAPHRLERDGMITAIHAMLEQDFQQAFDAVVWDVSEKTAQLIDDLVPPAIAEIIFAAVQEALRNAARHARGTDIHRPLRLTVSASCDPDLQVLVVDDGIGIVSTSSATSGTGGGLLTHSALLNIAGGNVTVKTAPGAGVCVRIFMPIVALR